MELSTAIIDEALSGTNYKCTKGITYHELHFARREEIEIYEAEFTDGIKYARVKIEKWEFDIVPDKLIFIKRELEPLLEALSTMIH